MSTLDVVAEILHEVAPRALKSREIAARAGLRLPTTSRTPETVVSRDLAIDVKRHGADSRFLRADRGAFLLKEALPTALFNEIDGYAVQWTRNLIAAGEIAAGVVDDRSIRDLKPADVASYRQFHAFSGIAVWSRALRDAGWSDDLSIWSGSAPCQPWSSAGRRGGELDDRHLWPEWFRLIRACGPGIVVGEQVASKDGYRWLDLVAGDFRSIGYHFTATELSAAAVGAPHKRQRLYFVAYLDRRRSELLRPPIGRVETEARGSGINALHTRVEVEADAGRSSGDGGDFYVETSRGPAAVAYPREGGRALVGAARLHDHGQCGDDAARCCEADTARVLSDATGARSVEWRSTGDLELERGGDPHAASSVPDAECFVRDAGRIRGSYGEWEVELDRHGEVDGTSEDSSLVGDSRVEGLQGGVSGPRGLDGTAGTGATGFTGCDCIGTLAVGDAGLARSGGDSGEVLGAEATRTGEWIEARDLADEPLVAGADDDGIDGVDGIDRVDDRAAGALVRGATDDSGDGSDDRFHGFRPGDRIRLDGDPTWGGAVRGFWGADVEWIYCRPEPGHQDGRWRPVVAGVEPLASSATSELGRTRSARLRAYGNSIVRETAKVFLEAVIEVLREIAPEALTLDSGVIPGDPGITPVSNVNAHEDPTPIAVVAQSADLDAVEHVG